MGHLVILPGCHHRESAPSVAPTASFQPSLSMLVTTYQQLACIRWASICGRSFCGISYPMPTFQSIVFLRHKRLDGEHMWSTIKRANRSGRREKRAQSPFISVHFRPASKATQFIWKWNGSAILRPSSSGSSKFRLTIAED